MSEEPLENQEKSSVEKEFNIFLQKEVKRLEVEVNKLNEEKNDLKSRISTLETALSKSRDEANYWYSQRKGSWGPGKIVGQG